jgi:hypothetical protein
MVQSIKIMKMLRIVLAQFALFAKCFASLKALNNKFNALEEENTLDCKPLKSERHEQGTRRSKRGTEETDIKKALIKLEKLEGR